MKKILVVICVCFSIFSNAQSQKLNCPFFENINNTKYVFNDTAVTYISPSVGAAIDDTLYCCDPISILMVVPSPYRYSTQGLTVPWYKIMFKKGAYNKVTFIPSTSVSITSTMYNNNLYVLGFIGYQKNENNSDSSVSNNYQLQLKIAPNKIASCISKTFELANVPSNMNVALQPIKNIEKMKNVLLGCQVVFYTNDSAKNNSQYSFIVTKQLDWATLPILKNIATNDSFETNCYKFIGNKGIKKNTCQLVTTNNLGEKITLFIWEKNSFIRGK
jgi:hypothetical protein